MSAGTGVYHSEHNFWEDILRLLQIWIFSNKKGYIPNYGEYRFNWNDRHNQWLHMISSKDGNAPIKINQDISIYSLELKKDKELDFQVKEGRQAYLIQIEGISTINNIELANRDGMEIVEEDILIKAKETSHILILEMNKQD